ncbi:MAG: hypothetical protein IIW14_09805 [Kiritimatiellae bacterium]|nr:hypothetical protein [Kiritimatiellia bacterium]
MAADQEYTTKIKIEADTSGGDAAAKSLDKVETKAIGLGKAFKGLKGALSWLTTGSFVVGGVAAAVSLYDKIAHGASKAAEAVKKLQDERQKEADASRIEKLADAYDRLKKSIEAAAKERQNANELEDMEKSASRELEDINAQAAKDAELAALDPNDRYYEQKKAQIEAKYSGQAANRTAQRKVEDAETAAARSLAEAEAKGSEAAQRRGALIGDRQELDILKSRAAAARKESQSINNEDNINFSRMFAANIKRVFSGRIEDFNIINSEEGDAKRKEAESRAKELEKQIKAKEKDIAEKEAKIAELEEEAQYLSQKSVIQGSMAENAKDAASVTRASGLRSERTASAALSGKLESDIDAVRAKALLEKQIPETERQIYLQKQRIAAADASVAAAQADFDNSTGSDKGRAAARLAQVKKEAEQVRDESNRYIKAISENLQGMKSALSQTVNILKKNNSQRLTDQAQQYVSQ